MARFRYIYRSPKTGERRAIFAGNTMPESPEGYKFITSERLQYGESPTDISEFSLEERRGDTGYRGVEEPPEPIVVPVPPAKDSLEAERETIGERKERLQQTQEGLRVFRERLEDDVGRVNEVGKPLRRDLDDYNSAIAESWRRGIRQDEWESLEERRQSLQGRSDEYNDLFARLDIEGRTEKLRDRGMRLSAHVTALNTQIERFNAAIPAVGDSTVAPIVPTEIPETPPTTTEPFWEPPEEAATPVTEQARQVYLDYLKEKDSTDPRTGRVDVLKALASGVGADILTRAGYDVDQVKRADRYIETLTPENRRILLERGGTELRRVIENRNALITALKEEYPGEKPNTIDVGAALDGGVLPSVLERVGISPQDIEKARTSGVDYERQQAALVQLDDFKDDEGQYNLAKAMFAMRHQGMAAGEIDRQLADAGFDEPSIEKARQYLAVSGMATTEEYEERTERLIRNIEATPADEFYLMVQRNPVLRAMAPIDPESFKAAMANLIRNAPEELARTKEDLADLEQQILAPEMQFIGNLDKKDIRGTAMRQDRLRFEFLQEKIADALGRISILSQSLAGGVTFDKAFIYAADRSSRNLMRALDTTIDAVFLATLPFAIASTGVLTTRALIAGGRAARQAATKLLLQRGARSTVRQAQQYLRTIEAPGGNTSWLIPEGLQPAEVATMRQQLTTQANDAIRAYTRGQPLAKDQIEVVRSIPDSVLQDIIAANGGLAAIADATAITEAPPAPAPTIAPEIAPTYVPEGPAIDPDVFTWPELPPFVEPYIPEGPAPAEEPPSEPEIATPDFDEPPGEAPDYGPDPHWEPPPEPYQPPDPGPIPHPELEPLPEPWIGPTEPEFVPDLPEPEIIPQPETPPETVPEEEEFPEILPGIIPAEPAEEPDIVPEEEEAEPAEEPDIVPEEEEVEETTIEPTVAPIETPETEGEGLGEFETELETETTPGEAPPTTGPATRVEPFPAQETTPFGEPEEGTETRPRPTTFTTTEPFTETELFTLDESFTLTDPFTEMNLDPFTGLETFPFAFPDLAPLTDMELAPYPESEDLTEPTEPTEPTVPAPAPETPTLTEITPTEIGMDGSPVQPTPPEGGLRTPPVVPGFMLPNGTQLPVGQYPRQVRWNQGESSITYDLLTGRTIYRDDFGPPLSPYKSFKVMSYMDKPPPPRVLDIGAFLVQVTPRRLSFKRDPSNRPREQAPRKKNPLRRNPFRRRIL